MSNGIVENIVAELSGKIKEVDDALIMDVVGVAQAADKLRTALAELDGLHPDRLRRRSDGLSGGDCLDLPAHRGAALHRASGPQLVALRGLEESQGLPGRSEAGLPGSLVSRGRGGAG